MTTIAFGGAQIRRPGSYSTVDTSNMTPSQLGSFRALGFVGVTTTAITDVGIAEVRWYNSQTTKLATEELGEGDLLNNMRIAWSHGADLIAVSVVSKTATAQTPATDAEWQKAIDAFNMEFVDGIVAVTTETAILTKVKTHVVTSSSTSNRKERRAFVGHASGKTKEEIITLKTAIADSRIVIASPAVYETGADGSKVLKTSVELASAYAGLWAGKNPQDPITYDYVSFAGLEKQYEPTDLGDLLVAGIAVAEIVKGRGIRVVQGVTTSSSTDLTERELSVSTLKDVMSQDMRETMENKHVGKAGVPGIEITIYNDAVSRIEEYKKNGWITDYVQDSVKVVKSGTAFLIDWEGKPTLPINNFLITSHFTL
jgi:hypothetical protein